ncbi:selenide, water dikinase SelD [Haloarcula taiwanensis]|uniref:Selenide, water dikinase SelD n=1 Tax=Haloarcula taiwanensis TaxID=1932004 RepID=A0A2H5A369_9EURY|nr:MULTISPECIES: selenide, water dikinase SelD [Haloarcula]AUG49127.1 selenide, water dikinase SelD [Haloarcula taiwanensis]RLM43906.1 selenide, water dikinase SelD [Haloarcula sp. Atlit-47R]RLM95192.1 selenide, water dikinase SelD [Haloarcula sp. Atlit-7R]
MGTDAPTADDETTRLTEYTELHGCSCKVGQSDLDSLLADAGLTGENDSLLFGIGEDAAARKLTDDIALVSTVDFFTPIVDDPYDFGRIAACNAASDAFATGAVENIDCLVTLGLPRDVTESAAPILAGMADALDTMDGVIAGGHTIMSPWPFAGGAISATARPDALLTSHGASPGDRLYLTKPLGTQPAMGATRVTDEQFVEIVTDAAERPLDSIASEAIAWMTTTNRDAMVACREYATAATDITGFGLAGQSRVMAARSNVGIELTHLPVIAGTPGLSTLFGYGLTDGESAETSGGLFVSVPPAATAAVESAFDDAGVFYRAVGRVTAGRGVTIDDPTIEEVRS